MRLEDVKECLPSIVHEIIEQIGFVDAGKLVEEFGGVTFCFTDGRCYFPKLIQCLGRESAVKLRDYFRHEQVYIPRCDAALRLLRNVRFKADYDILTQAQGKSGRVAMLELCPQYGFSDRYGWDVIRKLSLTTAQQSLF